MIVTRPSPMARKTRLCPCLNLQATGAPAILNADVGISVIQLTIRVAWSLAVAVVAGAILVILHVFDVYPERRLAFAVLGMIADQQLLEALQWTAVAAVAVVSAGLYNVVAWRFSKRKITTVDTDPFVPLKEAATTAYEETRGTKAAIIAEGLNRDDILGYYAYALFKGSKMLYGKHPPSRKLEPVPKEEYGRCGFSDDYSSLRRHGEDQNLYEDLQIRRSNLLRRITELKDLGAASSREERARKISEIYGDAVALRNHVFLMRVADAASEVRMNYFQSSLIEEMRELAPERTINLETINMYNELDHPLCNLQERTRVMVFSEVLLRVKKILEDYK